MNKTLSTLVERAERKGRATKRVRVNQIMGNHNSWDTSFVMQWEVIIEAKEVKVYHYDTLIFHIKKHDMGHWSLIECYGRGRADSEALNGLSKYYNIPASFSWGSSKGFVIN